MNRTNPINDAHAITSSPRPQQPHAAAHRPAPSSSSQQQPSIQRRSALLLTATTTATSLTTNVLPALADSHGSLLVHNQPSSPPPSSSSSANNSSGRAHEVRMIMRVTALRGSVPGQWVADFRTAMEGYGIAALTQRTQLSEIWSDLKGSKATKGAPTTVDCVSLADTWLQPAIAQNLIQPIENPEQYRWYSKLNPRWRQLIRRDKNGFLSDDGEVYGVPYRWGAMVIAYRKDKVTRKGAPPITDWSDLLRPELKNRIAFPDSPRDLLAVIFKSLGLSINTTASDAINRCGITEDTIIQRINTLIDQIRVFSSIDHVRALAAGEVDVIVGWSDDLIPLVDRAVNLVLVAPVSGSVLWGDVWCVPSNAAGGAENGEPSPLLPAWFELPLQPTRAQPSKGLRGGASPLLLPSLPLSNSKGRSKKQQQPITCDVLKTPPGSTDSAWGSELPDAALPTDEILQKSEFMLPIVDEKTLELYKKCLARRG